MLSIAFVKPASLDSQFLCFEAALSLVVDRLHILGLLYETLIGFVNCL
jgi:hypothetical protein